MEELIYRLLNMWKKKVSFFIVFLIFILSEVPYITSIEGTDTAEWYQCINPFYIFLWALPALALLAYIIFMRIYMPKAKKNTKGIIFYIINADNKQYKAIKEKFISPISKAITAETPEYSVVLLDDYHSQKYYSVMSDPSSNYDGEKQAKLLKKRRGCIAIFVDCLNGGEGEELFCHMSNNLGVTHKTLPPQVRECFIEDISSAFLPMRHVDIMKLTETSDLTAHSFSMDIICKYILASTCFHCGDFLGATNLLEIISNNLSKKNDLPAPVIPIKDVLDSRLAVCYQVRAQFEYHLYCQNHDEKHLLNAYKAMNNEHCKKAYEHENKVLEGICCFILYKDIDYAIQCMDMYKIKDPVIKYNKFFLFLYKSCTPRNIFRIYSLYKSFGDLPDDIQEQIESFTYHEYKKDDTKKQLLLILFFIYDYQNNTILAKRCLNQFCDAFPWVFHGSASETFYKLKEKYSAVKLEEGEEYSI